MRNKIGVVALGVTGIIMVAFSLVAFFLLDIERIAVNVWALVFLLLSEIVLFGGLIGLRYIRADNNKLFLTAGVSTTLSLYFLATLVSVFFAGLFSERLNTFILIELAIIVFFVITTISIITWSRGLRRNEADAAKAGTDEPKRGGF